MKKRILSFFMAVCMVVSMLLSTLPQMAWAQESAAVAATGNMVYLNAGELWPSDQVDYYVWAWGGTAKLGEFIPPAGEADSIGCLPFDIADNLNLLFVAIYKDQPVDWDFKLAQTIDLTYNAETPYFTLTGEDPNDGEGKWTGTWSESLCDHQWAAQVIAEASCLKTGETKYTCALCGSSYTETVPLQPHTVDGNGICTVCGVKTGQLYLAWEHLLDSSEYEINVVAWAGGGSTHLLEENTGSQLPGYSAYTLEEGDEYIIVYLIADGVTVAQTGTQTLSAEKPCFTLIHWDMHKTDLLLSQDTSCVHEWQEKSSMPADCVNGGNRYIGCTKCGLSASVIRTPIGHSAPPAELTVVTPPGCTTEGVGAYICENCQQSVSVTLPAIGHRYGSDGLCTACGGYEPAVLEDGYYLISDPGNLMWFAQQVNSLEYSLRKTYNGKLTADIDMTGFDWIPIGKDDSHNFCGIFDGQGHTVSNLHCEGNMQYMGLFGLCLGGSDSECVIRDLTVQGEILYTGTLTEETSVSAIGLICGYARGLDIENCHAEGTVENRCTYESGLQQANHPHAGGIVGKFEYATLSDCVSRVSLSGPAWCVGGIAGYVSSDTTASTVLRRCFNFGSISNTVVADSYIHTTDCGGIVGLNQGAEITDCANYGDITTVAMVTVHNVYLGGIVGQNDGAVSNCYTVGTVSAGGQEHHADPVCNGIAGVNCYYLAETENANGGRTAAQFASGQVAYELNGSVTEETGIWRQTLGADAYPGFSGPLVYYCETFHCNGSSTGIFYHNREPDPSAVIHRYQNGVCALCDSYEPAVDSDGDGYVEIDSAGKLWWFTHQVNNGQNDLNAELTANIDLSGTCGDGIGNWLPISHEEGYAGKFDGQGFTVSNLYISSDEQYAGLFGYVKGATIENVTVTGSVSSTFYWIYDPDTYESVDGAAGGIVACLDGGTIRNCESAVTVTGGLEFGGICGRLSSGIIEDCINRGTIICFQDSTNQVEYGGIVGNLYEGTVRGCTNHGEVTVGTRQNFVINVGGIVARSSYGTIENCINMSSIVGSNTSTGGIVGKNWVHATVRNCGNLGTVTGDWAGGITGSNEGIIEHCWNIAAVSGTSEYVGHIAGYISTDFGNMTNNYYLSDTTTEDGGRTAEQFASGQVAYELNGSTTTDESVWKQTLGTDSYPVLTGQRVYCVTSQKCDGTVIGQIYSNSSEDIILHQDGDNNNFCDSCGGLIITEKAFPDATFRTHIAQNIDTDGDGLLSANEIAAVTVLNVENLRINDITGLAYFTGLAELYAGGNTFASIDLSTLIKLKVLNLEDCTYLTQLDVRALTDLEMLQLHRCYSITSLNVENNGALWHLDLGYTDITSLDVSKNTLLGLLNIAGTGITSLDLSNNPEAGLLMGENRTYRSVAHCGVGYLNLSQFGDTTRMTITEGGTLGADGWLKLDAGVTKIVYEYDLQNDPHNAARLFVEITINNSGIDHNYAANTTSKDETGHYAQFCPTCRTGNEETFAPHTFDDNGVCTANCGFACTHGYDHTDSGMCSYCGKQRIFLVTVGGTGHYFDSLEDALAKAAEGTADGPAAVKLLADLTHTGQTVEIAKGGYVTFDLNGFTLDMGSEAIFNYGSLELLDSRGGGQITGSGKYTINSKGSFTFTSGTVSNDSAVTDSSAIRLSSLCEMIMNGGTAKGTHDGIWISANNRITINGGTVIGTRGSGIYINGSELVVNGGEIRGHSYGIESIYSDVHITGGTVDGDLDSYGGTLLLSGGTVTDGISTDGTLADCLAPGRFFHDANGDPIALEPDQDYIAVLVTVAECAHIDRDGDHICDVCGETVSQCADADNDHKCDVCGTVLSQCSGGTATCVAQAVCTICGQPYGELDSENHSGAADKLASNGNGTHNASYSCCGVAAQENAPCTPADCTEESLCACGYGMAATQTEHDFSGAYVYDENGHWRKCLHCEVVGPREEHYGQSTGDCTDDVVCDCGYVMMEGKPSHSFAGMIFGDETHHFEGCSVCGMPKNGTEEPHQFTFLDWDADYHWYQCPVCQAVDERIPHSRTENTDCTKDSYCACGYLIPGNAHHSGTLESCVKGYKCSCGQYYDSRPHEDANGDSICDVCGMEASMVNQVLKDLCDNLQFGEDAVTITSVRLDAADGQEAKPGITPGTYRVYPDTRYLYVTYTANGGEHKYVVANGFTHIKTELAWEDRLMLNVWFHLSYEVRRDAGAYLLFTFADGTSQKIMASEATPLRAWTEDMGAMEFCFGCPLTQEQMQGTATIQLVTTDYGTDQRTYDFDSNVIQVEITWGAMEFTYTGGTWNPDTHKYEDGKWAPVTEGADIFSVKNAGNVPVAVGVLVDIDQSLGDEGVYDVDTGAFIQGDFLQYLDPNQEKRYRLAFTWLEMNGAPGEMKVGTLTVQLNTAGGGE